MEEIQLFNDCLIRQVKLQSNYLGSSTSLTDSTDLIVPVAEAALTLAAAPALFQAAPGGRSSILVPQLFLGRLQ